MDSATVTLSATPTATPSASASPSATPTSVDTPSQTALPTGSPSSTATPSGTPSVSPSPSATSSLTLGPSSTASPSVSSSPTISDTPSAGPTASVTATATASPTPPLGPDLRVQARTNKPVLTLGEAAILTVDAENLGGAISSLFDLRNILPPGFRYVGGTAVINGVKVEPVMQGNTLTWPKQILGPGQQLELNFLVVAGAGAYPGSYKDSVYGTDNLSGVTISNVATVGFRVDPDPLFTQSWILGKVFYDWNGNGVQDEGEDGIPGARIATLAGQWVTTDAQGRYRIESVDVSAVRGSNFIAKLDMDSLPPQSEATTENPRVVRLTQGLVEKINFGVRCPTCCQKSVLRTQVMFDPCDASLNEQGKQSLQAVLARLQGGSRATLRLLGEANCPDDPSLAAKRVEAVSKALRTGAQVDEPRVSVQSLAGSGDDSEELQRLHFVLHPHFDSGRADLKPGDDGEIALLAGKVPGRVLTLSIFGHTDAEHLAPGTKAQFADNQGLSEARARVVLAALTKALQAKRRGLARSGPGARLRRPPAGRQQPRPRGHGPEPPCGGGCGGGRPAQGQGRVDGSQL